MDGFWQWLLTDSNTKGRALERRRRVLGELRDRQEKQEKDKDGAGYRHPSAPIRRVFR